MSKSISVPRPAPDETTICIFLLEAHELGAALFAKINSDFADQSVEETRIWDDTASYGQGEAIPAAAPAAQNHTHDERQRHPPLPAEHQEAANRHKSSALSRAEHPIRIIKRAVPFPKVRYPDIVKNANRLFVASALKNLFIVRRRLLARV